ncbi:Cytochrome P450 86B1 [Linum grandiflorum]
MSDVLLLWLALLLIYICWLCIPCKKSVPKWPLLGILPSLLWNLSRNHVHEFATRMIKRNGRTFHVRGSIFASLNWVVTCDPLNVRHILCRNFSNYPKGQKLKKITEALGDVLINSDGESWKLKREIVDSLLTSAKFQNLYTKTLHQKLETTLIPILEQASCSSDVNKQQQPLDLQDLMKRFTFDVICSVILGFDPESCCREYSTAEYSPPRVAFGDAFDLVMEVIMHRYCIPECVWKLQRWFGIGMEREFGPAVECVDDFLEEKIRVKMMERFDGGDDDFLRDVVLETERGFGKDGVKSAKEILFTMMLGGRDTVAAGLSWFFWLVATNPDVERKILEEMDRVVTQSGSHKRNNEAIPASTLQPQTISTTRHSTQRPRHRRENKRRDLHLLDGEDGGDMGRGLLGVQTGEVGFTERC